MAKKRLTPQDRMALEGWNELVASIRENSDINPADSTAEIETRKKRLEADDEAWFRYYFAQYYLQSRRLPQEGDTAYDGA